MNRSLRLLILSAAWPAIAPPELAAELSCAPTNLLKDGGFELASGNPPTSPDWSETSTNFGSPICTVDLCGAGAFFFPRAGDAWVPFRGMEQAETATVSQSLVFPFGTHVVLQFYYLIGQVSSPYTDLLQLRMDGVQVMTLSEPSSPGLNYSLLQSNLDAYADGGSHTLTFEYTHPAGGGDAVFNVDDFRLVFDQEVVFMDGGFEFATGFPLDSPYWVETSTAYVSPLCTTALCGGDGELAFPRSGKVWSWFGGPNGIVPETASLAQIVFLPAWAYINLDYYLWISRVAVPPTDTLTIQIDGITIRTHTEPLAPAAVYEQNLVVADFFADGELHVLTFTYHQPDFGGRANFNLDDVSVFEVLSCRAILLDGFETHDTSNWSADVS